MKVIELIILTAVLTLPTSGFVLAKDDSFKPRVAENYDRASGDECGPCYPNSHSALPSIREFKLLPADGNPGDSFGYSVSSSADWILVGNLGDDDNGVSSGSAYIYAPNESGWAERQKLLPSDGAADDIFGMAVSLSGNRAAIGAPGDSVAGSGSGSVYIYEFNGAEWVEVEKLTPSDGASGDGFGRSVSLLGDSVLIGAPFSDKYGTQSGSAYVFQFDGATWTEVAILEPADASFGDGIGYSVSMSNGRALIGAFRNDDNGSESGSAYIFVFEKGSWNESAKLLPSDGAFQDQFGRAVTIDGNRALIGAPQHADYRGAAYLFQFDGQNWNQQHKLTASDNQIGSRFGESVGLSDGQAVVGAPLNNATGENSGAAYEFIYSNGNWVELSKFVPSDAEAQDQFGFSAVISKRHTVIGSIFDDDFGSGSGSAYVLDLESLFSDNFEN